MKITRPDRPATLSPHVAALVWRLAGLGQERQKIARLTEGYNQVALDKGWPQRVEGKRV